ncbi:hypothetical protein Tco_1570827 [Tanacetum coccineum]
MKCLKALQSNFKILSDDLKDFGGVATFKRTFSQDMDLLEKYLTKEILHEIDCKTDLTKLRTIYDNRCMDFIEKYMIETILHEQDIQQLLNEKKLQTQKVQSITVQASNIHLVVIDNTCSRKENSNSYTAFKKSVKESSLDSKTKDVLSKEDLKCTRIKHGFKQTFMSLFGQDDDTFTNYDSQMTDMYFIEYTGIKLKHFKDTLLQHLGNVKKSIVKRTEADLVVTKSNETKSEVHDESSKLGNDTDADDVDIRPISKSQWLRYIIQCSKGKSQSVVAEKADILKTNVTRDSQLINKNNDRRTITSTEVPTVDMIVMMSMTELESLFGPMFEEYFNEENQVVSKSPVVTTADASDKRQ